MDPFKRPKLMLEDEKEKRRKMLGLEEPKTPQFTTEAKEAIDSTNKALNRPIYQKLMDLFKKDKK